MLFLAPLADSLATVRLVRERLLLATAFALVLALVLGLTAAGMLSHRLLRLETAAERIAGGDFGAPIVDHGNDEIGELARAFDQMRVQLAQLDNARKEFVANASHELRTPLFSIGGFLELLAEEDLDEETRRGFIETMQGQVQRLAKLSTDLLDLSRVDAGQLGVAARAGRPRIGRPHARRRDRAPRGVERARAGDATSTTTCGARDDARILQIGRALATNAITHTPPGTKVTLSARRRGDRAELVVEDDGPGNPARVRGMPSSVGSTESRAGWHRGAGSGSRSPVSSRGCMGGDVTLESVADPTVFVVDLPGEPVHGPTRFHVKTLPSARARRRELSGDGLRSRRVGTAEISATSTRPATSAWST